ncbi:MAG: hypothetical protein GXO54_06975 [Chloroflexi bacterium]|nr:hypothetical protein [Chloroflexota bacterium]
MEGNRSLSVATFFISLGVLLVVLAGLIDALVAHYQAPDEHALPVRAPVVMADPQGAWAVYTPSAAWSWRFEPPRRSTLLFWGIVLIALGLLLAQRHLPRPQPSSQRRSLWQRLRRR